MKRTEDLAQSRRGRVVLHVACMLRGGDTQFHIAGIQREWRVAKGFRDGPAREAERRNR